MGDQKRTAVIIADHIDLLEPLAVEAGYEVLGAASTVVNGERLAAHFAPDVIVVENELTGAQGWESLSNLNAASPSSKCLLVVAEGWNPTDVGAVGAYSILTRSRLAEIVGQLGDIDEWLDTHSSPGNAPSGERRSGRDRRLHQDWNKVGWERRSDQRRDLATTG